MKKILNLFSLRTIRYIFLVLSVIGFTYAIQIFMQNFNIEKEISNLKNEQVELSGDTYWIKNFYAPFLKTDYAKYIFKHRSGITQPGEIIVKIQSIQALKKEKIELNTEDKEKITKVSCREYFQNLYEKYFR